MKKISQKFLISVLVTAFLLNPLSGLVKKSQAALTSGQVSGKALAAGFACFAAVKLEQYSYILEDEAEGATGSSSGAVVGAASDVVSVPVSDKVTRITVTQKVGSSSAKQKTSTAIDMSKKCVRDTVVKIYMDWIVDQTITWIQGGGKPQFVQNWGSFLQDAADTGIGEVVSESGAAFLCSPFKANIKLSLYPVQRFKDKVGCTLDKIVENVDNFMEDFQKGSWIGYGSLWSPNNNQFGNMLLTYDEASARAAAKKEAAKSEASASGGFLSTQTCLQKNQDEVNSCLSLCIDDPYSCGVPDGTTTEEFCESNASCSKYEATTPGKIIGDVVAKSVTNDMDWMNNVQSWTAALANAAINRLITGGLSYMSSSGAGTDSYTAADFSVTGATDSISASSTASATDQLLIDAQALKTNVINNEQLIYDYKSNTYQQLQWAYGIYTSCNGVATVDDLTNIGSLMSSVSSTMVTINDSYLIANSGFQITADQLLTSFVRTDLTSTDLQTMYNDFVSLYATEIRDVNSGDGLASANTELSSAQTTLSDARTKANPTATTTEPKPTPPDATVTDATSACGKAYVASSATP